MASALLQAISSRPDVAPPSYTQELEKLQDQIPPFPTEEAMAVMQRDMGQSPSSVFSYLTPQPVAAASLGQVQIFVAAPVSYLSISEWRWPPTYQSPLVFCITISRISFRIWAHLPEQ